MPKTKGKSPDKMCQLILKYTHSKTETIMQKSSIYLLGMSNPIFNFIFKTWQYPFVASLCWYVYFKVFFKKMILQG